MKMAPVQGESLHHGINFVTRIPPGEIPWAVHELAMKHYNTRHNQTSEQMAGRDPLDWSELIACLRGNYCGEEVLKVMDELKETLV